MRSRTAALLSVALLMGAIAWRQGNVSAAEDDLSTWGATDATWSPDGRQLAFTLFGSIWRVDANGGDATQVSTSRGYHAHPAWSPKGDSIAFINGAVPA